MIRHLFTMSLVLAAVGCHQEAVLAPNAASRLGLSVAVSASSVMAGQPDTITITLANSAPDAVTLHFGSGCQILPYIADAHGTLVLPGGGGWMCTAALSQRTLAPHQTQTLRFVWTGSTTFASEMPLLPLPSGLYYVFATLEANEARLTTTHVPVQLQ